MTVVRDDDTRYATDVTWGAAGDSLRRDVDPTTHPAWTGGAGRLVDTAGQVAKFNKRFQDFGLG